MFPYLACSQTQRKGLVVGEEEIYISRAPHSFSRARFARELANVFKKNKKKNKTVCVQVTPYFTLVVILGSIVHCSFEQGLIISWLQNRERLKVAYLRFTLLLKCLRGVSWSLMEGGNFRRVYTVDSLLTDTPIRRTSL